MSHNVSYLFIFLFFFSFICSSFDIATHRNSLGILMHCLWCEQMPNKWWKEEKKEKKIWRKHVLNGFWQLDVLIWKFQGSLNRKQIKPEAGERKNKTFFRLILPKKHAEEEVININEFSFLLKNNLINGKI